MLTTSPSLLDRLRRPDQAEAWGRFVRLYSPLLLHWARRNGLGPDDAADLAQEVLLKLLGLVPEYNRGAGQSFRGWLARVAANQCRDYRRRRATRPLPGPDGLSDVADGHPPGIDGPEYRTLLVRRGLELVRGDFGQSTWAAFAGLMLDGKPAAEVAAEVGVSENAVYLARHRVLARLRQELDGLLD